ncbi:MAG: DUF1295 domain-containing protein [Bacteroidota bacterium]|nr:DUF1295 domain-containing protein [Bacteroidota bacterium]
MDLYTFNTIIWIWIGIAIMTFTLLLKVTAPYGRHSKSNWGPMISNRTGWIIMEIPALVLPVLFFILGDGNKPLVTWIFLSLFTFHYLNRVAVFPFRLKTKGKKMPIIIVLMAICFNLVNGFSIGYFLGNFAGDYSLAWLGDWRFILGVILFFMGMYINWKSDNRLIHLRKNSENGYHIPYGGLFKYVSCPNHFGEIIEWIGYAVLTWCLPGLSFAAWTMANLIPRALDHHKWYEGHFEDYPKERKAVIPFTL